MARLLACCLTLALALPSSPLAGQEEATDPELAEGMQQAQQGDFEAAIITLDRAARRLSSAGQRKQSARAYLYLSIAYLGLSQEEKAMARFLEAWRADSTLDLSAREFPPKILGFFEEALKEALASGEVTAPTQPGASPPAAPTAPPRSPAPEKKKRSKTLPILIGVGAAAAVGVAVAAGGGGEAPEDPAARDDDLDGYTENAGDCNDSNRLVGPFGTPSFSARFETPVFDCPDNVEDYPDPTVIVVEARNNACNVLSVNRVGVVISVVTAFLTTNQVGQTFSQSDVDCSPRSVGAGGVTANLRVQPQFVCSNSRGPSSAYNELTATVNLETSAGAFSVQTSNRHRTNFPLASGPLGAIE